VRIGGSGQPPLIPKFPYQLKIKEHHANKRSTRKALEHRSWRLGKISGTNICTHVSGGIERTALNEEDLTDAGCGSVILTMASATGATIYGIDAAPGLLSSAVKDCRMPP
jgi:2-polyprenyl-3-methyl-5-hydroxy-6-metoxy-1,4-benzoquinol methylase